MKVEKMNQFKGLMWVIIPFIFLVFFLSSVTAGAQSMADIQNIKVDDLSDSQIEQLIKRAESAGMTEDQLEAYALEKGMPIT